MDFIKGNEQVKIDPSGIDISGAGLISMNSTGDVFIGGDLSMNGDLNMNGDLSMNGNLEVYNGKIGIGKTPAYNYNLDVEGSINCTGTISVNGESVQSGNGDPIIANGMIVQIRHRDYKEKVVRTGTGWQPIDSREDGNGFVIKIKPTSPNSKVLVSTVVHVSMSSSGNPRWWGAQLWRKKGSGSWEEVEGAKGESDNTTYGFNHSNTPTGTSVWFSNNQGIPNTNASAESYLIGNSTASYLDSPGTTEEVMYTLYWNSAFNNPSRNDIIYLNRAGTHDSHRPTTTSSITATEIWDEPGAYIPTNSAIMVDGTNDNVGIGTSTPATGVDIHRDLSLNGNIEISNNDTFVITNEGNVGIGTSNPQHPLHIIGTYSEATNGLNGAVGFDNQWTTSNFLSENIGIKVEGSIWIKPGDTGTRAGYSFYLNSSDRRIKTDISLIDDSIALDQVNQLESHQYNYISGKKPMKTIGFIAQEVKEVVPNAVSLQTEYIPDEMRIITEPQWTEDASNNWLLDIPELDMSGNFTGKAKFYVSNDPSGNDEVCKEVQIKEVDGSTPLFTKTKFVAEFDQSWNNVFFYGKEVNDFHTIDKAQIFALHHSAIQELSRRNDTLQQENTIKTNKIASLESRIDAMESAFLAMQALVESTIANA